MRRFLPLLALALLAQACGSTGRRPALSEGARVELTDARIGLTLGIVNDAYLVEQGVEGDTPDLRRSAFYSARRADVWTKVADDELIAGLIRALDREGFARYGSEGTVSGSGAGTALAIATANERRRFMYSRNMSGPELQAYQTCRNAFMDVYNYVPQYQATDPANIRLEERPRH